MRLIEDFLAKTGSRRCLDFKDVAEKLQMAFKMYFGSSPSISNWSPGLDEFSLIIDNNPLTGLRIKLMATSVNLMPF